MDVIRLDRSARGRNDQRTQIACFDFLRAAAALAVVMLHAGVPYLQHRMPGLVWPVDDQSSRWVDGVFWAIEVMIMPLFLVIAGFLMWQSSRKVSPGRLIRSRAKRLLIPFVFGLMVILPADLYIWTLGLAAEGTVPLVKLKSLKFEPELADKLWGTSHLWFLLYVFLYVAVAALGLRVHSWPIDQTSGWSSRTRRFIGPLLPFAGALRRFAGPLRRFAGPRAASLVLLAIAGATLALYPEVVWGFQHAFLPVPSKWVYSGMFFTAGCVLAVHDPRLDWVRSRAMTFLALSTILLIAAWMMGTWYLGQSERGMSLDQAAVGCLAVFTVGAAAATTLGLIGGIERFARTTPQTVRYLAAASFWIYLVHHPLLGLIHIDLKWLWPQGSPAVKMLVSFAAATTLSLISYEVLVRQTRLGGWLGMAWPTIKPTRKADHEVAAEPKSQPQPERRAA